MIECVPMKYIMTGDLIDTYGYPRTVISIEKKENRIIRLTFNDNEHLIFGEMEKIPVFIHLLKDFSSGI